MTLIEFLRTHLDERAKQAEANGDEVLLLEVNAKRLVIASEQHDAIDAGFPARLIEEHETDVLRLLAVPYRDHTVTAGSTGDYDRPRPHLGSKDGE